MKKKTRRDQRRDQRCQAAHSGTDGERTEKNDEKVQKRDEHRVSIEFVFQSVGHVFLDRTKSETKFASNRKQRNSIELGQNDAHRVVKNTFAENHGVKIDVDVQIVENRQHCH